MGRSHYRLDKRHYHGIFTAGFRAHLSDSKFWQTDDDPFHRARRRRRKIAFVLALIAVVGLAWVVVESSRALRLF